MKKKYLFFDIDGTLTTGGFKQDIPKSARNTLKELQAKGHLVGIATGRPYSLMVDLAHELDIHTFICNGGNTVVYQDDKILNDPLNQEEVHQLIDECIKFDYPFCISEKEDFYFLMNDMSRVPQIEDNFILEFMKEKPDLDPKKANHIKRLVIFIDKEQQKKLSTFQDLVPQRYGSQHLMIEPDDKFYGIKYLMETLNAPIEDVVVFGDGENDLKMFRQAPYAIAVGNAIDELKELADYVTDKSSEDGIRNACMKFGWIDAK